jgi:tetratricopeptide (TPR) repeat protein
MFRLRGMILLIVTLGAGLACGKASVELPTPSPGSLDSAEEYLARGDLYASASNWEAAIADYDQALALNPDYAEAYNNRGYAYYWSYDAARAVEDFNRAIALRPDYPYAYNNRGTAYMTQGDMQPALVDFSHAIALQPDFPQAYTNRGNAYLRTGQIALALADFEQAGQHPERLVQIICGIFSLIVLTSFVVVRRNQRNG